eukprot:TRINITY_DN788_c0_g5_i1.p1 TRINITY_DN788_c0_g5~~TRINITY_DN788_c0_g5_i1.p1  ORF type:complete len:423 (+),score=102.41 TRINITY_DN788_c0_g5_i1:75-1271(+)
MLRTGLLLAAALCVTGQYSRMISNVTTPGDAKRIAYGNNLLYVADRNMGLSVVDFTTDTVTGTFVGTGSGKGVAIKGTTAFLVGNHGIDSIDTTTFTLKHRLAVSSNCETVFVSGNYAYVSANGDGLIIVDISNEAAMTTVSTLKPTNGPSFKSVTVSGSYAFVADYVNGLVVVNVATPASPVVAGTLALTHAYDLSIMGNNVFVAGYSTGMFIVDVTNKATPVLVSTFAVSDNTLGIDINADATRAYLASGEVYYIDTTDKAKPVLVTKYVTSYTAYDVVASGNKVFVAGWTDGVYELDATATNVPDTTAPDTPMPITSPPSTDDSVPKTTIAAIVVGSVLFIVLVVAIVVYATRREPSQQGDEFEGEDAPELENKEAAPTAPSPVANKTSEMEPDV